MGTAGRRGDEVSRPEDVWCIAVKAAFLSTQPLDSRTCVMLTFGPSVYTGWKSGEFQNGPMAAVKR